MAESFSQYAHDTEFEKLLHEDLSFSVVILYRRVRNISKYKTRQISQRSYLYDQDNAL